MIFYRFLLFIIIVLGGYIIYRVATEAWRKSSLEDKIDELDQIDKSNTDEEKKNREDIDNFLKL